MSLDATYDRLINAPAGQCRRLPQKSARREFQRIRNEKRACVDDGVVPGLIGKREVITDLRGATAVSNLINSGTE